MRTQEEKDLLLKDLCARLPYGVKVKFKVNEVIENKKKFIYNVDGEYKYITNGKSYLTLDIIKMFFNNHLDEIKPYLFPLSSMTKEQYEEWCNLEAEPLDEILTRNSNGEKMSTLKHHLLVAKSLTDAVNYCYKNHFDIYGLIPMGLANDATDKNIY